MFVFVCVCYQESNSGLSESRGLSASNVDLTRRNSLISQKTSSDTEAGWGPSEKVFATNLKLNIIKLSLLKPFSQKYCNGKNVFRFTWLASFELSLSAVHNTHENDHNETQIKKDKSSEHVATCQDRLSALQTSTCEFVVTWHQTMLAQVSIKSRSTICTNHILALFTIQNKNSSKYWICGRCVDKEIASSYKQHSQRLNCVKIVNALE